MLLSDARQELSKAYLRIFLRYPSGTMMVRPHIKRPPTTQKLSSSLLLCSRTLLDKATIFLFSAIPGCGVTVNLRLLSQPTLTSELMPRRSLTPKPMKNLGSASNKNMLFLHRKIISPRDPLDGLITDSLGDKEFSTAQSERTSLMEEQ